MRNAMIAVTLAFGALASAPASAQENEETKTENLLEELVKIPSREPSSFGSDAASPVSYTGDELTTRDGKIVLYQTSDEYDGYTAKAGSNATFIDMKTGVSTKVVPPESDELLLNLDLIYDDSAEEYAVGYLARVGTPADYSEGVIDLVVGRFSDMKQVRIAERVRYADAPTFVLDNSVAVIVWLEQDEANYVVINLASLEVERTKKIPLPEAKPLPTKLCECRDE